MVSGRRRHRTVRASAGENAVLGRGLGFGGAQRRVLLAGAASVRRMVTASSMVSSAS